MASSQSVREYDVPITHLGQALFPGEEHFTRELQGLFSEMLLVHLAAGKPLTTIALGASLAEHIPLRVLEATAEWKERDLRHWEGLLRPKIFAAMEEFLLNGGFEQRADVQASLLSSLEAAGVEIEGKALALDTLAIAGDWHRHFLALVAIGRPQGIRFLPGSAYRRDLACTALSNAGFDSQRISQFVAHVG